MTYKCLKLTHFIFYTTYIYICWFMDQHIISKHYKWESESRVWRGLIGHSRDSPTYTHIHTQAHTHTKTNRGTVSSVWGDCVWLEVEIRWKSRRSPDLLIILHVFYYIIVLVLCLHLQIYVVINLYVKLKTSEVHRVLV